MRKLVVVIDYGMGNVGSVLNMVKKVGGNALLSGGPDDLQKADALILPGIGAFDAGMNNLRLKGYLPTLRQRVLNDKIPILGICLGMQLFTDRSQEGQESGLGWVPGECVRFPSEPPHDSLRVPHMGWNEVIYHSRPAFEDLNHVAPRYYFVHSYYVSCADRRHELATARHGITFTSAILMGNILGTQFHPEKSHRYGMEFFRRFLQFVGA